MDSIEYRNCMPEYDSRSVNFTSWRQPNVMLHMYTSTWLHSDQQIACADVSGLRIGWHIVELYQHWFMRPRLTYVHVAVPALVSVVIACSSRSSPLDTSSMAFQPPHSANRHDAGCRGAGADRRRVMMASGLSDHVWTIKELIEAAAEV